jgi:hypothetical protein
MSNEETNLDDLSLETPDSGTPDLETPEAPQTTESVKPHPAHEKLLAELPEAWHQKVLPHLQEQDKYYQQQLEKFSPYKDFIDGGVDADYINQSIQLAQAIAEDPITIHENLTRALMAQGLLQEDAEEAASEIIEDEDLFEESDISPKLKKELAARDQKLEELERHIADQDFARQTAQEYEVLEAELSGLKDVYEVTPQQEQAIIELMESSLERGQDITVIDAAKKLVGITGVGFKKIGGSAPNGNDAPIVVGSTGGVPFEAVSVPKDFKDKKTMLAQMFEQQLKAGPNSL